MHIILKQDHAILNQIIPVFITVCTAKSSTPRILSFGRKMNLIFSSNLEGRLYLSVNFQDSYNDFIVYIYSVWENSMIVPTYKYPDFS